MVTARYLTNKFVKPLIKEHEARGEARERSRWLEWNARRIEAEKNGVTFDEPPPAT